MCNIPGSFLTMLWCAVCVGVCACIRPRNHVSLHAPHKTHAHTRSRLCTHKALGVSPEVEIIGEKAVTFTNVRGHVHAMILELLKVRQTRDGLGWGVLGVKIKSG